MRRLFRSFTRTEAPPAPPPPDPDPLLGHVQRGVLASIGALTTEIRALAHKVVLLDEASTSARQVEQRLMKIDTLATGTRALLEEQVQRLDASINQLRGLATGGNRGGGGGRNREENGAGFSRGV